MDAVSEQVKDMEKVSKELLKLMSGGKAMNMLKHILTKQEQMIDKLLETQKTTKQLIQELMTAEVKVAQKLADQEEELNASLQKLQKIEDELLQASEKDDKQRTSTSELRKELEALREEIKQEKSMAEAAETCMAAKYLVHLYYAICHIDWDYSCEPEVIKGTHYGPDIAQPIYLSTEFSRCFISNYLWSLVSTDW
ncbi:kinetochore protein Spc24 [Varanus komodoensis]|uniref:kinetochore protein Spc24 n=1 Tax=Varanus komodoensis TaxID=61221 RepID=UPI001CF7C5E4|nr:kinetochore protein Spc24 [Varanus komodoensis]